MFVLLCYDIKKKRVSRVRKTVIRYLRPVQKSVFEGFLTIHALGQLKADLAGIICPSEDSVRIYSTESYKAISLSQIGNTGTNNGFIL